MSATGRAGNHGAVGSDERKRQCELSRGAARLLTDLLMSARSRRRNVGKDFFWTTSRGGVLRSVPRLAHVVYAHVTVSYVVNSSPFIVYSYFSVL